MRLHVDLPCDVPTAYGWLTDLDDGDVALTGAVTTARRILERDDRRIVYEGMNQFLGIPRRERMEVTLQPPDRWAAHVVKGPGRGSVYRYRLTAREGGCRLDVVYELTSPALRGRVLTWLAQPVVRRDLQRMWDGYREALVQDLGGRDR